MRDTDYTSLRREFLGVGLTGAMVGLAGCSDSVTIDTESDDEDDENTETPDIDTAEFSFSYDETAKQARIEFTGGATIDAGNVQIRHDAGLEVLWAELGSTTAGPTEDIEAGSVAVLGPETLNWETPIEAGETIRLIYIGKETPATLERYSPPESTDSESTVPASISGFATTGTSDQQLRITFDSTKRLETLRVGVSGATSATLTQSDFSENGSSGNTYTYTATYTADADGSYTATLEQAIDIDGGNALNGENISDTAGINTEGQPSDTTPPSISAFSIANPSGREIRISFDSTEELNSIRVSISGPESVSLTATDFTQTAAAGDQISYESTYQAESDGEYTASLVEAIDSAGNDGATGAEVSVIIEDSSDSGSQMLIGDDFETDHNMEPYEFQTGVSENYDWGTTQTNVPGDGSHVGWIYENDSGQRTVAIATSNETVDWNTTHEFNFKVRCTEYSQSTPWNSVDISWRGGIISEEGEGQEEETTLRLSVFSTDGSENPRPFQWGGKGIVDGGEGYEIGWETSTWYNIRGYVDQESGAAEAKIWKNSEPEPDNYQISATVSTESANNLPYSINVDARSGSPIRFEMAQLRWSDMEPSSQSSGFDPFTVTIDGRSTYLTKDSTDSTSPQPAIISLSDRGISEGDEIEFEVSGLWTQSSDEEPDNCRSNAVFSQTNELLAIDRSHRVPGAIDAGEDVETNNTYNADRETDIPEDFSISSKEDGECSRKKTITVPEGAEYLFIGVRDSAYADNSGELEIDIRPG